MPLISPIAGRVCRRSKADPRFGQKSLYWAVLFKDEHETLCHSTSHGQAATQWNAAKRHRIWDQNVTNMSNNIVKPELEDPDASSSIGWDDVELPQEKLWEESPPPLHEPDDEIEWPGTTYTGDSQVEFRFGDVLE
jgi:hypothetical protein